MNTRDIAVVSACAAGAGLLLFSQAGRHRTLPRLTVGTPAEAQAPADALVHVQEVPDMDATPEHLWHRYQITVPPQSPPLEMHLTFFLDRKGYDFIYQRRDAWPQTIPLAYRLDKDEDARVKTILEAQGLPIRKRAVTYHIEAATDSGTIAIDQTLTFRHGPAGAVEEIGPSSAPAAVGREVLLEDELLSEADVPGDPPDWQRAGYFAGHPLQHRLTVSVTFKPYHGPPVREQKTYARQITRA